MTAKKKDAKAKGFVSLVGAGPGDPGLITVTGLDRIRQADVVVYDRLANSRLLDHARPETELIDVGKIPGDSHDQAAINQCLIENAGEGKRVVRLKGGDPFVFGRGGEEAEALRAAGIAFEIVPGVTSAVAVPAYAGIPVTHRGIAQSFAVITGHEADTDEHAEAPASLVPSADTLVFLMGVKSLPETVRKVTETGRSPETPVAVIRWGTTPDQQTVVGTLADIVERVGDAGLKPPAVTVVGEVVRMRETISWFESKPLFGKRVLITRTRKQASTLAKLLAAEGAIPIELPSIEIQPSYDEGAVEKAMDALGEGRYAWTVFTSANAVDIWMGLAQDFGHDARLFGYTNVAAIGPATAERLAAHGIIPDLVPSEYVAEGIVQELGRRWQPGKRPIGYLPGEEANDDEMIDAFLLTMTRDATLTRRERKTPGGRARQKIRVLVPRAEDARPELVDGLRAEGAEVDEVTLYRAAVPTDAPAEALEMALRGHIDIVTLTSSSTARNLAAMLHRSLEELTSSSEQPRDESSSTKLVWWENLPLEFIQFTNRQIAEADGMDPNSLQTILGNPTVACIGPITAETARELGLRVDVEAAEHTVAGLVDALVNESKEASQ